MDNSVSIPFQENTWRFLTDLIKHHVSKSAQMLTCPCENINTELLLKLLQEHRLELISYALFTQLASQHSYLIKKLQEASKRLIFNNLRQKKILSELASVMDKQAIRYFPFKGISLNQLLYSDQCLRCSVDIDILINPADLLQVHHLLLAQGFQIKPDSHYSLLFDLLISKPSLLHLIKDIPYFHPRDRIIIEVHWQLMYANNFGIKTDLLTKDIPKENYFLYLCMHGAIHHWQRLQWLIDIAVFSQRIPVHWQTVSNIAKQTYSQRALLEATILLREWFNIAIPITKASRVDRTICAWRLRNIRKNWKKQWQAGDFSSLLEKKFTLVFYQSFLFPKIKQKKDFLLSIILNSPASADQLKRFLKRPLWLVGATTLFKKILRC